jgi:hypothetical protein
MPYKSIFVVLILVLNLFGTVVLKPKNCLKKCSSSSLAKEANELMKVGDYEKSLIKSRLALQQAIALKDDNLIAGTYNTLLQQILTN